MKNMSYKTIFSKFIIGSLAIAMFPAVTNAADIAAPSVPRENCSFTEPESRNYDLKLVSVRRPLKVDVSEKFEVKAFYQNTGNVPIFSSDSTCPGAKTYLGTDKERDHSSKFYSADGDGWIAANRVKLDQTRVNPGEVASFTFTANAGKMQTVYKEYFAPVVDAVTWIDQGGFDISVIVGEPGDSVKNVDKKMRYAGKSGDVLTMVDLEAAKKLVVDLSDQTMEIYIGDNLISKNLVSSGGRDHATPTGTHTIVGKQDVRIGGASPHYIMPRFQMLSINGRGFSGFGIHGLPSIGNSGLRAKIRELQRNGEVVPTSLYYGDSLWNEAVDHLGRAVSHGCIRIAPDIADFLFEFTDVGETQVVVQR